MMEEEVEVEDASASNKLEHNGNQQTMNLENILHLNILQSPYFKDLLYVPYYVDVVETH